MQSIEIATRIRPIESLQKHFFHWDENDLLDLDRLELRQMDYVPTIGSEVEVTWSSMFPHQAEKWFADGKTWDDFNDSEIKEFDELCRELDGEVLPRFEAVTNAGVPKGQDSYWEFAHKPAKSYRVLAREMGMLMSKNVAVVPTDKDLPLHITLGNLASGSGAFYVLAASEINGGTTGARIRTAIGQHNPVERNWARKAVQGLYVRAPSELVGANEGVELRTLVAIQPDQVLNTLRTSQMLGAALNGARAIREGSDSVLARRLDFSWGHLTRIAQKVFSLAGLADINKPWLAPFEHRETWECYADFIDGEKKDDLKQEFVNIIKGTVHTIELDLLEASRAI